MQRGVYLNAAKRNIIGGNCERAEFLAGEIALELCSVCKFPEGINLKYLRKKRFYSIIDALEGRAGEG